MGNGMHVGAFDSFSRAYMNIGKGEKKENSHHPRSWVCILSAAYVLSAVICKITQLDNIKHTRKLMPIFPVSYCEIYF